MQDLLISTGYFHIWKLFLDQKQLTLTELGLSASQHIEIQNFLQSTIEQKAPLSLFNYVLELTRQAVQSDTFLFDMVKNINPQVFGLLGYITSRSANLYDALNVLLRFSRLAVDGQHLTPLQLEKVAGTQRLHWPLLDNAYIYLNELNLLAMVHVARSMTEQPQLPLLQVHYAHAALAPAKLYQAFLGCPVYFQQPRYELIFLEESLTIPSKQADPQLIHLLFQQAEAQLDQLHYQKDHKANIQFILAEKIKHAEIPTITALAGQLGLSERTLQRYLKNEGTSFKQLLEQVKMQRCDVLLQQQFSLVKIAEALGYSDQSALARAYKKYYGIPMTQRIKHLK